MLPGGRAQVNFRPTSANAIATSARAAPASAPEPPGAPHHHGVLSIPERALAAMRGRPPERALDRAPDEFAGRVGNRPSRDAGRTPSAAPEAPARDAA